MVAAPGPSLTPEVARAIEGELVIAVQDAYRLLPCAAVMYGCNDDWWFVHEGCTGFAGERWSSHGSEKVNDKRSVQDRYGIRLVRGAERECFSSDPSVIHYGSSSGFQAINLAIHFGACPILLVGFDMHARGGRHFFGNHPEPLDNSVDYAAFMPMYQRAAAALPPGVEIINCTPDSALTCFPMADLNDALAS